MTSEDWWQVGCRLLGVYFVVSGALTVTGALMMSAMGLPEGTRHASEPFTSSFLQRECGCEVSMSLLIDYRRL